MWEENVLQRSKHAQAMTTVARRRIQIQTSHAPAVSVVKEEAAVAVTASLEVSASGTEPVRKWRGESDTLATERTTMTDIHGGR